MELLLELIVVIATWPEQRTSFGTFVLLCELTVASYLICGGHVFLDVAPFRFVSWIVVMAAALLLAISALHETRVEVEGAAPPRWSESYERSVWPLCFTVLGAEVAAYYGTMWFGGPVGTGTAIVAACGGVVGLLGLGAWVYSVRRRDDVIRSGRRDSFGHPR